MKLYLAIDPGREKCGIAVLSEDGAVVERRRCETTVLAETVAALLTDYPLCSCLFGNGTGGKTIEKKLREVLHKSDNCAMITVDETSTTEIARALYWQANPPHGWRKFLPISMLVPPEPIDDWAAVALARRWLEKKFSN